MLKTIKNFFTPSSMMYPLPSQTIDELLDNSNFKFLIIGAGRSGSSLMAGILDFHPEIEVGMEFFSIDCLMGRKFRTRNTKKLAHERTDAFLFACARVAQRKSKKIWGNKMTTEQLYGLEHHNKINTESVNVFDLFFKKMGNLKIIHILRDGRANVYSKMKRAELPLKQACDRWKYAVSVYKYLQNNCEHCFFLRYEDLIRDPSGQLHQLCKFIGIPFRQEMLQGTMNKKMLPEYRSCGFNISKLDTSHIPNEIEKEIYSELKYCEYL